jgi:putative acetyltransferase
MITIRPEEPKDYEAIRDLIIHIFHETYGSGEAEADLVECLRSQADYSPELSLVAEDSDQGVIGHVMFSSVQIEEAPMVGAACLGPLCVRADFRKQGIGSQLVNKGLAACKEHGYDVAFVTGGGYYRRFGFRPIADTELRTPFDCPHDQVLELTPSVLTGIAGLVIYPPAWNVFI